MSELTRDLRDLIRLSLPVVASRLGIMTMGLVDAIVVGHNSSKELGYQSLGWAPTAAVATTAIGLLMGVQVMTARHIGEGRPDATGGVYRRGVVYALWLGLLMALGLSLFGPMGLHALGLETDLADGASKVMRILAWSMPFQLTSTAAIFYLEALHRPGPATTAMWGCNLVNLALNLLFVPGTFGIPAMGAVGSAFATLGSRTILAGILAIYILRMKDARALGLFDKPIDGAAAARIQRRIGYGGGASQFVEAGAFTSMNVVAGWVGGLTVAGWAVVLNLTAVIFMVPLGLSAATAVLVGRAYGAGDRHGMVRAGNLGFAVTLVVLLIVSAGVALFPHQVVGIYSTDPNLVVLAGAAVLLGSLYFVFDGLQVIGAAALRARGDVLVPTITHIISYAVVMVPLAWWLAIPQGLGLTGIILAVIVASILAAGFLVGRFWILARRG